MSEIIRDTFVYLHSSDVMGRLVNEVCATPPNAFDPPTRRLFYP